MQRALFCFQCLCTVAYSSVLAFLLEVGGADGCRLGDVEGVLVGLVGRRARENVTEVEGEALEGGFFIFRVKSHVNDGV